MSKIKIDDIPETEELSDEESKKAKGGWSLNLTQTTYNGLRYDGRLDLRRDSDGIRNFDFPKIEI